MVEYSHFERSAVCASSGLYVGREASEVQIANPSGRLMQAGTSLIFSHARTGYGYFGNSPTVAAGTYRIAAGSAACSVSCTIDTGLTTVHHAVCNVMGGTGGFVATLDKMATCDGQILKQASAVQWRIKTSKYLWVKAYRLIPKQATMGPAYKYSRVSWIAFGE